MSGEMTTVKMVEENNIVPGLTGAIESVIPAFRPYSTRGTGSIWHDQVKSVLCALGLHLLVVPLPEFRVPSRSIRGGTGRIDVVWFTDFGPRFGGYRMVAAFEIDDWVKSRSMGKLVRLYDAPARYVVSSGSASEGIKRVQFAQFPDDFRRIVKQIIVTPTDSREVYLDSVEKVQTLLREWEVTRVH